MAVTIFTGKESIDVATEDSITESTPEPTEEPTETPTPEATEELTETPTPEPTEAPATVHTHNYTLTASIAGENCVSAGVDTYTCNCGDSYTTANANIGVHTWTAESYSETIHHDAVEHYEAGYICGCGIFWAFGNTYHPEYECPNGYSTGGRIVTDSPAYDEVVNHSRTYCTSCGTEQ